MHAGVRSAAADSIIVHPSILGAEKNEGVCYLSQFHGNWLWMVSLSPFLGGAWADAHPACGRVYFGLVQCELNS